MNERLNAIVGARISEFRRKMATVNRTIKSLPKNTKITITAVTRQAEKRIQKFQGSMARLANSIRAIGTVAGNFLQGGMLVASPAAVPAIASITGALGSLLPILGTAGGGFLGLGSAATSAAGGLGIYASIAQHAIKRVSALDASVRRGDKSFSELPKTYQNGIKALRGFNNVFYEFRKDFTEPIVDTYTPVMQGITSAIRQLRPALESTIVGVDNLANSFKEAINGSGAKAFFEWMGNTAGTYVERFGKTIGNLIAGFGNLMVAFDPLADSMTSGFLDMTARFNEWSASIQDSKALQNFISYVQTNGPKLLDIFGNIVMGLVGIGQAFAPMSADMLTGFQQLTEKFQQWGQTLSENQQFQQFISYIRENAPTVMSLIGNITMTLVNLGIAMAPLGQKILELVNSFFAWTSSMLEAHPIIGKIFGVLLVGVGVFQMIVPLILSVTSLFGGLGATIARVITRILPLFSSFKLMFITGFKMIGARFLLFTTKLATTATTVVASLLRMSKQAVIWAGKMIAQIARVIARFAVLSVKAALHAAKVALSFTVTMVTAAAKATASMVASIAKIIARYALLAAKSMVHAAKVAASWVVAMGPVGWVIGTIVALVALVIANWEKVKSWTTKIWSAVSNFINNAASQILGYIQEKFPALYNVIKAQMTLSKNIVTSIWNFIKSLFSSVLSFLKALVKGDFEGMKNAIDSAMSAAQTLISNILNAIKSFFSSILGNVVSTVKSKFQDVVNSVRERMNDALNKVTEIGGNILDFFSSLDLYKSGKAIIQSAIDGIMAMKDRIVGKVEGIVQSVRNLWPFSPAKEGPLSDIHRMDFAGPIGKSIAGAKNRIMRSMASLAGAARNAFNPDIAMANVGAIATIDASINSADLGTIEQSFGAELNDFELPDQEEQYAVINIGGHEAKGVIRYISSEQDRANFRKRRRPK